jgi:hypothetical protein
MARPRSKTLICVLIFGGAIVGCDKKVKLTFVNTTSQTLGIDLTAPGEGTRYLGVVGPVGGKLTHNLKIDKELLPATCSWRAGGQSDQFTVTKETKKKLYLYIEPTGHVGPVDEHTEIEKTREVEIERIPIYQEEVIE